MGENKSPLPINPSTPANDMHLSSKCRDSVKQVPGRCQEEPRRYKSLENSYCKSTKFRMRFNFMILANSQNSQNSLDSGTKLNFENI